jgi:hypothetical protein
MPKLTYTSLSTIVGNESAAVAAINANMLAIQTAIENTLSRDGTTPNTLSADLDLNSNDLLNGATINCTDLVVAGTSLATQVAAAAASAAAALVSETNAAASEAAADADATATAADAIATAADAVSTAADAVSTAADAAATAADAISTAADAATATTQASNASTSASNAATSETNAATSASNASTSETNAATSASNASTSATAASTAQTAAELAQTLAEASSENSGLTYEYDTGTSGAGITTGLIRFNNANLSLATAAYIHDTDYGGSDQSGGIATWDDVNNSNGSGILVVTDVTAGTKTVFTVTYNVGVDNTSYWTHTIAYVSGATSIGTGDAAIVNLDFSYSGTDGGGLTASGTPVDSQIGVWTSASAMEGDADFTFDTASNTLSLAGVAGTSIFAQGGANILVDSPRGTMTLSNIDALDATTETTIEAAIDTLSNLTSVGTITTGVWNSTFGATAQEAIEDYVGAMVGGASVQSGITVAYDDTNGELDFTVDTASTSAAGIIESAIASEINTGTSTTLAVTPDSLAGSNYGTAVVPILVFDDATDCATGDGAGDIWWRVPSILDGWDLVGVAACVQTAGTTGTMDIQIHNVDNALDMLSTKITIDSAEKDSSTAATAAVINTSNDHVNTGDQIRIDVDAVQTTPAKGLLVELQFRLP